MTGDISPDNPPDRQLAHDPLYGEQSTRNAEHVFSKHCPFHLFEEWLADARDDEINDANAMSLATVDKHGTPDVRMVLLKGLDKRGFVFYTNDESAKGQQLTANPEAALCFHWKSLRRQVRIRGTVEKVGTTEADAYFASRPRASQIGAWASDQSRPVETRHMLEARVHEAECRFAGGNVPRPDHWNGWRVVPMSMEFWRDRPGRLHDRMLFTRRGSHWDKERLFP